MAEAHDIDFWLWALTVATAIVGGVLSLVAAALRRRAPTRAGAGDDTGHRLMLTSYGFMTASMLIFAARGFL